MKEKRIPYHIEEIQGFVFPQERVLAIRGWLYAKIDVESIKIKLNDKECKFRIEKKRSSEKQAEFECLDKKENTGIVIYVYLPLNKEKGTITFDLREKGNVINVFQLNQKDWMDKFKSKLLVGFNEMNINSGILKIRLWAFCTDGSLPQIKVFTSQNEEIECDIQNVSRVDVSKYLWQSSENSFIGYLITMVCPTDSKIIVEVQNLITKECVSNLYDISECQKQKKLQKSHKIEENIYKSVKEFIKDYSTEDCLEDFKVCVNEGIDKYKQRLKARKLKDIYEYEKLLLESTPGKREYKKQRHQKFKYMPRVSILVPCYRTPEKYLIELLECLKKQTYSNWELCLIDASMEDNSVEKIVKNYQEKDGRIMYRRLRENAGISQNTNEALKMASGEYIGLLDHDDVLTADALYEIIKAINENDRPDVLYTDEDKLDMKTGRYYSPNFKPDFNLELLRSCNYIVHFLVVKTDMAKEIGGFLPEYNGSQDFDFVLRCIEKANQIVHIPKVLYHWRSHMQSTALNPQNKLYAFEAGAKAIKAHYLRSGIDVTVIQNNEHLGLYEKEFMLEDMPMVTVIVIDRDKENKEKFEWCKLSYSNIEIIEADPKSTKDFNKKIKNTKGEYILVVTSDSIPEKTNLIEQLLGFCMQKNIEVCAPRVYNKKFELIYGGVVFGWQNFLGYAFEGQNISDVASTYRFFVAQNYYAINGPVFMTSRKQFDRVGGISEDIAPQLAIIDYCLKVQDDKNGVVWIPYSNVQVEVGKKEQIHEADKKIFIEKWVKYFENIDPNYNPNYSLRTSLFSYKSFDEKIDEKYDRRC